MSSTARAEEVRALKPTSPWNVDYADDSCALRRTFATGGGDKDFYFELRQFAPGDYFQATVAAPRDMVRGEQLEVRFEPDTEIRKVESLIIGMGADREGHNWSDSLRRAAARPAKSDKDERNDDDDDWTEPERNRREAEITGLLLQRGFGKPARLETGELHKPMEAMRACLDELLTHWGIDAAAQRTLTRKVEPLDQVQWARDLQSAYPSEMLRKERNGLVRVRLIVGPDGKPKSCHAQVRTQDPSFEQSACSRLMRSARFEPALDANGAPITSYYVTSVIYLIN